MDPSILGMRHPLPETLVSATALQDGDLHTHLNNLGLAPLYTDLNPDSDCGLDSCGSIQIDYYEL